MRHPPTHHAPHRTSHERRSDSDSTGHELPVGIPPLYSEPGHSTGTVDDEDEPEDEHDGENEASVRERNDDAEAPEEIESDSDGAEPP
jgi:hypothetical protein